MIGVFDSGFGGLHVLKSVMTRLAGYGYVYLGDNARAPYGPRSQAEIYACTKQGVDFLFAHGAQLVVLACNTASSEALRKIQMEYGSKKQVLGVLIPFAEAAATATKNRRIGVIATEATVRSRAFVREITKFGEIGVFQEAAPELVPLIEAGEHDAPQLAAAIRAHVEPLLEKNIDTLVLGCTHYGIVREEFEKACGVDVRVIAERDVVPEKLEAYLARHSEIGSRIEKNVPPTFFTTGDVATFERIGSGFFGSAIRAQHADLL